MKRLAAVLILVAICGLGVAAIVVGVGLESPRSLTTDTHSSEFTNNQAKIAFLRKYLIMYSEIEAAEFHIRFIDGSDGWLPFPAPSDIEMQVVMKMPRDKLHCWIADFEPTDEDFDITWGYELLPKENRWAIQSHPSIFIRGTTLVAVFDQEGIVFKSVSDGLVKPPNAHSDASDEHQNGASSTLQPPESARN